GPLRGSLPGGGRKISPAPPTSPRLPHTTVAAAPACRRVAVRRQAVRFVSDRARDLPGDPPGRLRPAFVDRGARPDQVAGDSRGRRRGALAVAVRLLVVVRLR